MSGARVQSMLTAAVALAAVLIAGGLAGAAFAGHTAPARRVTSAGASPSKALTGQPGVTAVPTTTYAASALPGYDKPVVLLGDENEPEQFIIGELYKLALEHQGYAVQVTNNVNSTGGIALKGLTDGSLDIYPAYLDEWNAQIPKLHQRFQTLAASYSTAVRHAQRQGVVLLAPTPFSDTVAIAITNQYAAQNHVTSIADLAHGTGALFAGPLTWETSPHGLPALERAYDFKVAPGAFQPIAFGQQYLWLRTGDVNVTYAHTTDPQLNGTAYRLLRDPKHVFGFGNVVPVTTQHALDAEGPAFAATIERVDSVLTTSAMRGLNAEVQTGGHGIAAVAQQFLQGHGILTPVQYAAVTQTTSTEATTSAPTGAG